MNILNGSGKIILQTANERLITGDLDGQGLQEAEMPGFDFGGILITGTSLAHGNLAEANLYWCGLIEVDLSHANLRGANLQGCNLVSCDFRFSNLVGANFCPSNLGGPTAISNCNFTGADFTDAVFASAIYDELTKFPLGFDPAQHHMIRKADWDAESYCRELAEQTRLSDF